MPSDDPALERFLQLTDDLGELEVMLGQCWRPLVADAREGLRAASDR